MHLGDGASVLESTLTIDLRLATQHDLRPGAQVDLRRPRDAMEGHPRGGVGGHRRGGDGGRLPGEVGASASLVVGSENRLLLAALSLLVPESVPATGWQTFCASCETQVASETPNSTEIHDGSASRRKTVVGKIAGSRENVWATQRVTQQFNPLVLTGPTGVGKSLLVQAAVGIRSRCVCVEGVEFGRFVRQTREEEPGLEKTLDPPPVGGTGYSGGIRGSGDSSQRGAPSWHQQLEQLELLAIENLDRTTISKASQREMCIAIDTVLASGGLVVATASRDPGQWERMSGPLRDRLTGGLIVPIRQPGLAARRNIVRAAAAATGVVLTSSEVDQLASQPAAPRALWGSVSCFHARRDLASVPTTTGDPLGLKQLVAAAARYFGISQASLVGKSRRKSLVHARGVTIRVARLATGASYAAIGQALGGRDHTTVSHAERKVLELAADDSGAQFAIDDLLRLVTGI
jgi:chromosomal replication initiation ATPase DnaA